jgi:hypothetical protein
MKKMSDAWYSTVGPDVSLTQGDIVFDCPLLAWEEDALRLKGLEEVEVLKSAAKGIQADVVVMTQACDLEHEKVENVILCPHLSLVDYRVVWKDNMQRSGQNPTEKAWNGHCNDICDGFMWDITMLNAGDIDRSRIGIRVVFFNEVFTVPRTFLESLLTQRGTYRFRLLPPYREHLSQAFARFFMRVGLPIPIEKKWYV